MTIEDLSNYLYNINAVIVADSTLRFVDTDGFYELQITLVLKDMEIYLTTIYGHTELENEYKDSSPRMLYINDVRDLCDKENFSDVENTINEYKNNSISNDDFRLNSNLKYQYLL